MTEFSISDRQLLDYLDEMLPVEEMSQIETELRESEPLRRKLSAVSQRRDKGEHSVGEIWRQGRLSCTSRRQLGQYLLNTLDGPEKEYVEFHLHTIGCRVCTANLIDLQESTATNSETTDRRRKYFQTSVGYLSSE